MQVTDGGTYSPHTVDLHIKCLMRVSEEGMCDKRFLQALVPKTFAAHERPKVIPRQLTPVSNTPPKRNMMRDHNDT